MEYINPLARLTAEEFEVDIRITSSGNTHALHGYSGQRMRKVQQAAGDMIRRWMERSATGELRWVTTRYPTEANAQDAEMSMPEYADFFYKSCYADQDDPVAAWMALRHQGQAIAEKLSGLEQFHLRGPDIDLTMSLRDRSFIMDSGQKNMPDGEIFTGPVEGSVEGWVRFSYPCIHLGTEVYGVELTFEGGKVTKASALKNQEFLLQQLGIDQGAQFIGELGIGLNQAIQRFTKNMLFDEKIAGTIHLALGAGYPETGSLNKSAIHWDMLVDMQKDAEIIADGEIIYKDGVFVF